MERDEIRAHLSDEDALRLTLYGEARGEPVLGQIGVAWVIRNRLNSEKWGRSYRDVCFAKMQFSCWWTADANGDDLYREAERVVDDPIIGPFVDPQLAWVAQGVYTGALREDPSRGATNYLTASLYRSSPPYWALKAAVTATLGHHVFIRLT